MNKDKVFKIGFILLAFLVISPVIWIILQSIFANADFPFALFMDERITYEPINKALKGSIADQIGFIFDGKDTRYGRLLWNLNYFLSGLPYLLFGDSGQVISVRLVQSFAMIIAFTLLLFQLIRSNLLRLFCFLCLLLLPPSFYYYLMPKPEPLIILCLAVLIYSYRHQQNNLLLIGIGVLAGLKISMLPFCLFLLWIYYLKQDRKPLQFRSNLIKDLSLLITIKNLILFAGFSVFVYILLNQYLQTIQPERIYLKLINKNKFGLNLYTIFLIGNAIVSGLVFVLISLGLSKQINRASLVLKVMVKLLTGFAICNPFMLFTPFNLGLFLTTSVTHGGDRQEIGFIDWMEHICHYLFFDNVYLLAVGIVCFVITSVFYIHRFKPFRKEIIFSLGFIVLAIFIINVVPVVFFTKRLWGFYLQVPVVFLIVFYTLLLDRIFSSGQKKAAWLLSFPLLMYIVIVMPHFKADVDETLKKEQTAEFKDKVHEYNRVCLYILKELNSANKNSNLYWDPNLFFPDKLEGLNVKIFWGPFNSWDEGRDLIVFSNYPDSLYRSNPGIKNAERLKMAIEAYKKHTDTTTGMYREAGKDSFKHYKLFIRKSEPFKFDENE